MAMEEVKQRISILEERSESHASRLNKVEVKAEDLSKISILLEMQTEMVKSNQIQLAKQQETLSKINENLTQLTNTVSNLDNRVVNLEDTVNKIDDNSKINWHELMKKVLIMGAISIVSMAAMFIYTNMK